MANLVTYAKQKWEDAKTAITAARLNNMEDGIGNCAAQINALGDSASRLTETVQGDYGKVSFIKSGPVCLVKSTLTTNETVTAGKWTTICTVPAWVATEEYWLTTRDSVGRATGIWTIRNGEVQVYLQSVTDKTLMVEGVMMMR